MVIGFPVQMISTVKKLYAVSLPLLIILWNHFRQPITAAKWVDDNWRKSVRISCNTLVTLQVEYKCDTGHNFQRLGYQTRMIAICINSLNWSPNPSEFKCSPVICEDPPKLPYSTVVYSETKFQSTASYSCSYGYNMKVEDSFQQSANGNCILQCSFIYD